MNFLVLDLYSDFDYYWPLAVDCLSAIYCCLHYPMVSELDLALQCSALEFHLQTVFEDFAVVLVFHYSQPVWFR